jgi:hypothetical protein
MFDEAKLQASFVKWRYALVRIDLIFLHVLWFLVKERYRLAFLLNEIIITSDHFAGKTTIFTPKHSLS